MIPANAITTTPITGAFYPPEDGPYTPGQHTVLGGVAIGDASKGRQVKHWRAILAAGNVSVQPVGEPVAYSLPVPGATTIALAFDNNMAVVLAWQTSTGSHLYYFDTLTGTYLTKEFNGTTSCRVAVDDARDFYNTNSDVIFAYTKNNTLYWRHNNSWHTCSWLGLRTTFKLQSVCLRQSHAN
jgi:hypothetical protein